jgi:dTDP-4-amino-4,6-dideoxygalactose transaminase
LDYEIQLGCKTRIDDLAIIDGVPAFQEKLHVGRPNTGNRQHFLERLNDLLDRRWLTNNGPFVQELEQRIAAMLGIKHCIAVCNGSLDLELAAQAAGLHGEVIVPAFTHIVTAYALHRRGITPVFCDIEPQTHNLDPNRVKELVTPLTSGILAVHMWGRPCNVDALGEIASQNHLKLLYDAAHAFGNSYHSRMIGEFGDAEVLSFHATKVFNTIEGGAVVTNDADLAAKVRVLRNTGFVGPITNPQLGTNAKLNEVAAAMGLTLLEDFDEIVATNLRNYKEYQRELDRIPGIKLVLYDESEKCNYQYVVIQVDESVTRLNRDQLMDILWAENVLARRYFYPGCHRQEPYLSSRVGVRTLLPETEKLAEGVLCMPTGLGVRPREIKTICQIISFALAHAEAIQSRLARGQGELSFSRATHQG